MAVDKLAGKTKFVATKILATPDGTPPPFYQSPRSFSPPWRHCKRVRSPPVAKKPSPMPSKSQVVAPRFSWSLKSKHSCLGAAKSGCGSLIADFLWLWRRRLLCNCLPPLSSRKPVNRAARGRLASVQKAEILERRPPSSKEERRDRCRNARQYFQTWIWFLGIQDAVERGGAWACSPSLPRVRPILARCHGASACMIARRAISSTRLSR